MHSVCELLLKAPRKGSLIAVVLAASIGLGACSTTQSELADLVLGDVDPAESSENLTPQERLHKATTYWGKKFARQPKDLNAALSYARNLKASGQKRQAMQVLQQASFFHSSSRELAGEYGRLALELGNTELANKLLARATDQTKPDAKIIASRGAALAKLGQYSEAIPLFQQAAQLTNGKPSIINNLAMAYTATGNLKRAESLLRDIVHLPEATPKMRQNLALVLGLQGRYTEAKAFAAEDAPSNQAYADIDRVRSLVRKTSSRR